MIISSFQAKWLLRLFPPLFFNRIWVSSWDKDILNCVVKVKHSPLNRNLNGTIFGGTIFSAADPFYALIFWQAFARKGIKVQAWLKSASIQYKKPADCDLYLHFSVSEQDILEFEQGMNAIGKHAKTFNINITNKVGDTIYATVQTEVYTRLLKGEQKTVSGF